MSRFLLEITFRIQNSDLLYSGLFAVQKCLYSVVLKLKANLLFYYYCNILILLKVVLMIKNYDYELLLRQAYLKECLTHHKTPLFVGLENLVVLYVMYNYGPWLNTTNYVFRLINSNHFQRIRPFQVGTCNKMFSLKIF